MLSDKEINELKSIIRKAGEAVMEEYESFEQDVIMKKDNSPLTNADLKSNQIIQEGLENLSTQFPIISEENKRMDNEERMKIPTFWLVDPLDGTKEFVNKNGEFAICIALIHNAKSIAGFIYAPVSDELYYAVEGKGAVLEKDNKREKLEAKVFSILDKELSVAVSRSHRSPEEDSFINTLDQPILKIKGSILKMTEIARGNMDLYPRFDEMTKEWDIAAGQIILEEAGGEVIHKVTEKPIRYNKSSLNNPPFLARAKTL